MDFRPADTEVLQVLVYLVFEMVQPAEEQARVGLPLDDTGTCLVHVMTEARVAGRSLL